MRTLAVLTTLVLLLPAVALAQVSHPAEDITPGNFPATGNFRFLGTVYFGDLSAGILPASAATPRLAITDQLGAPVLYLRDGKLGVGVSDPSTRLDVSGGIRFRNFGSCNIESDANGNLVCGVDDTGGGSGGSGGGGVAIISGTTTKGNCCGGLDVETSGNWVHPFSSSTQKNLDNEQYAQMIVPTAGTIRNLRVLGIQGTYTTSVTVRVNGADTALRVDVPANPGGAVYSDGDSVSVAAGDKISLRLRSEGGGAHYFGATWSFEYVSSGGSSSTVFVGPYTTYAGPYDSGTTPTKFPETVYQNGPTPRFVSIYARAGVGYGNSLRAYVGPTSATDQLAAEYAFEDYERLETISFIVPPNYYYKLVRSNTAIGITTWTEMN